MHNAEKSKRLPLITFGHAPAFLLSQANLPFAEIAFPADPDLYILVCARTEEEMRAALQALLEAGVPPDHILIAQGTDFARCRPQPFTGILEVHHSDSAEDLRLRLLARLELQKHRKLAREIEAARNAAVPSGLTAEEWKLRLECAHLAHGFSCALEVSASRHALALRRTLRDPSEGEEAWRADTALEDLLAHCARLALHHWQNPAQFREQFRIRAAALPFRLRTDLRNVVERCMESVWKGAEHVA